jgi:hypothetical protein
MQSKLLNSLGLAALVAVSPIAVMAQEAPAPPPDVPMPPAEPMPPEAPPAPGDPMPTPPAPAPQPMPEPLAAPVMAPPAPPQQTAATEPYPLCTKTLQDSCRNPGEGPKATQKKRR